MSEIYEGENFAQLLEDSFKTLNTGDIVKGVVTSVAPNELKVDLSTKVTGIVPFDEVAEDSSTDLTAIYKVGDTIEAKAIRVSDVDGVATLSVKQVARITNFKKIAAADESGEILEVLKRRTITKDVPPDVRALLFYLKNRCPERWDDSGESQYNYQPSPEEEGL